MRAAADRAPTRRDLLRWCAVGAATLPWLAAMAAGDTPPPEVAAAIPQTRRSGSGEFRYFGFLIYRATLWVGPEGLGAQLGQTPFALQLRYARDLKGADIAARSDEEMRKLGEGSAQERADWLRAMRTIFPDVHRGDTLTGVFTPAHGARPAQTQFFYNGKLRGSVPGAAFARAFFAIWLSPDTPAPELRNALLAQQNAPAAEER
jgi:hypothetical protein